MHLTQHLFLSYALPWRIRLEKRDRVLIALAGVAPDIDGLLLVGGERLFIEYHHDYTHHLLGAVLVAGAAYALGRRRGTAAALAAAAWLGHLLLDLVGAADRVSPEHPAAYPLPLLWPFSDRPFEPFAFGWTLASWQNAVVMAGAVALMARLAVVEGRTVVEVFSARADAIVVAVLRRRLGGDGAIPRDDPPGGP